jgi:hypothetical protein
MKSTLVLIEYTCAAFPVVCHDLSCVHLTNPLLLDMTKLVTVEPFGVPNFALVRSCDVQVHFNTSQVAWSKRLYRSEAPSQESPEMRCTEQARS